MKPVLLATTSSYKTEQFARLGIPFDTCDSGVIETFVQGESPSARAERLSAEKARAVADGLRYVIAGDQVIALGDEVFSKPVTAERAVDQLMALAGKTHQLLCACTTIAPDGTEQTDTVRFDMEMRPLSRSEAEAYVTYDTPLDCAGSYKIESRGVTLFRAMRGDDYTAIVGLPLTRVFAQLESLGFFDG